MTVVGDVASFNITAFREAVLAHFRTGVNQGRAVHDVLVSAIAAGSVVLDVSILTDTPAEALQVQADLTATEGMLIVDVWGVGASEEKLVGKLSLSLASGLPMNKSKTFSLITGSIDLHKTPTQALHMRTASAHNRLKPLREHGLRHDNQQPKRKL